MIRYDFSTKSLLKITTLNEIVKFSLGRCEEDYKESLIKISDEICRDGFKVSNINQAIIGNKTIFETSSMAGHYALKKISKDLKRVYRINTSNRDDISEQLLRILEYSSKYGVIRLDVKSFYESISYADLIDKLKKDKLISVKALKILSDLKLEIKSGIPRGLSISPVLSEIFMREIDYSIKCLDGVYYYARYVDDIVIITTKPVDKIFADIELFFKDKSLFFNDKFYKKDILFLGDSNEEAWFDYLGYKFRIKPFEIDGRRKILVGLSDDKIRKYKTRIVHSLLDRSIRSKCNTSAKSILINRIKYLTGNYKLFSKGSREGDLKGGVYYSNKLVTDPGTFMEISQFLRKGLSCDVDNFFGRSIKNIPNKEKDFIKGFCFREGFVNRTEYEFSKETVVEIKKCWKHKKHKRSR